MESFSAGNVPLVDALIQAVRMERDEFHERCNNSYSTDALMLAKERVALCKQALLDAHCRDCCCARSWKALGIAEHTGKSIPEHISELKAVLDTTVEALECLLPGLILDLRYAEPDDDTDAMRSRVKTVADALAKVPVPSSVSGEKP